MFDSLRQLCEDIWNNDSDVSWDEFEEKVMNAYADGRISSRECDSLLAQKGD